MENEPAGIRPVDTDFGSTPTYLILLFGSLAIMLSGLLMLDAREREIGMALFFGGFIVYLVSWIVFLVFFYRFWRFSINMSRENDLAPAIKTPGQAVGYLFIPFYNIYWIFHAFYRLPKDLQAVARLKGVFISFPAGLGIALAILSLLGLIPYLGVWAFFINGFILYPVYLLKARKSCFIISEASDLAAVTQTLLPSGPERLKTIRRYPQLFDRSLYGFNYSLWLAFIVSSIAGGIIWRLGFLGFKGLGLSSANALSLLLNVSGDVLVGLLLVVVSHLIVKERLLPLVWALLALPLSLLLGELKSLHSQQAFMSLEKVLDPHFVLPSVIMALFFMAALVLSVRLWGVRLWSLSAGLVLAYLLAYGLLMGADHLMLGGKWNFSLRVVAVFSVIHAVRGMLLYAGLTFHVAGKRQDPSVSKYA